MKDCNGCDETDCQDCCEHTDKDCGHCQDCGKDCLEDMMADAYDRAKSARYDD